METPVIKMEFACKKIDIEDVIRCSLDLKKSEYKIFEFMLKQNKELTIKELSKKLNLDRTTIQKILKGFVEKDLVKRFQENLDGGGYIFVYRIKDKPFLKDRIKNIVRTWFESVNANIERW